MEKVLRPRKVSRRVVRTVKRPFDEKEVFARLRRAVRDYTPAAMFQLADEGFDSIFEILVACIISVRTFEEVTLPTARKLFASARTLEQIARLSVKKIDDLIHACTFHRPKAEAIHKIAKRAVDEFDGEIPCDFDTLTSFHGVGPKCANLVLGVACKNPHGIAVDIHVHRVTNRWGYVRSNAPDQTMAQLEAKLPKRYWIEINKLLVPFGKFICTAKMPKCSTCPLLEFCKQVGVSEHR
jgi:endonuclease III